MTINAWPFLISASVARDYGIVVIPDFANIPGARGVVLQADSGLRHKEGEAIYYRGQHPSVGSIDLVFRVIPAMDDMIDGDGSMPLLDGIGRPIRLIEGVVLRESRPDITVTSDDLDMVTQILKPYFKAFWESSSLSSWTPEPIGCLELEFGEGEALTLLIREQEHPHRRSPQEETYTRKAIEERAEPSKKAAVPEKKNLKKPIYSHPPSPREGFGEGLGTLLEDIFGSILGASLDVTEEIEKQMLRAISRKEGDEK